MLSVSEAQAIVLQHTTRLPPHVIELSAPALGLVLAEDVVSDLDMPPYDKSMMDGYALRTADLQAGKGRLRVIEEITAGRMPTRPLARTESARIMTGAPVPEGADAVVMVERTTQVDEHIVDVDDATLQSGKNILRRGQEMRRGDTVLRAGAVVRPQELGLLATVGRTAVKAHPAAVVAVLSTGDEVVDPAVMPAPGQIRNSNGPMLLAQVARAGAVPRYLGIAGDRLDSLRPLIADGLRTPVLVLSGGVSAGKLDLVPGVLEELGVQAHFHKVTMKPGKPVFFGTTSSCLVFGLPGNPVSSYVCFELFVRPALRRLAGHIEAGPRMIQAALAEDFAYKTDRPTYHPVQLRDSGHGWVAQPAPWFGSPDLRALTNANAFVLLPAGDHRHRAGQVFPVLACD